MNKPPTLLILRFAAGIVALAILFCVDWRVAVAMILFSFAMGDGRQAPQ